MPYPLPDEGPPYTADLRWFLVAVPDDTAFVRAAMGAYTELTKYWMWGHEGKEPGRNEAAQVWEAAVAATLEALEMGFPDVLLGHIDDVETLLQGLIDKPCCIDASGIEGLYPGWESIVGGPDEIDNTGYDIVADIGSPPTGAADWTEWHSKLCEAAQKYADGLPRVINLAETVQGIIQGLTIAAVGALIATATTLVGIPIVVLGIATTVLDLLERLESLRELAGLANPWDEMREALDNARQDIVCAIITADTPLQASQQVQGAIIAAHPSAWDWIRLLTFPGNAMQRIFNMQSDVAGGFYGPCGTCGDPVPTGIWLFQESFDVWTGYQTDEHCFTSHQGLTADFVIVFLYGDETRTIPLVGDLTVVSDSAEGVSGNGAVQYRAYGPTGTLLYSSNTLAGLQGVRCHRVVIRHNVTGTPGTFQACLLFENIDTV